MASAPPVTHDSDTTRRNARVGAMAFAGALFMLGAFCAVTFRQLITLETITIDPTQLKGRWVTAAGVTPATTAVVVPDANGAANAWLLAQDASRLVKLVVRSDSSANGKSYALGQGNATGQAVTGQVNAALAASPKTIAFTGLNTGTLTQSDTLATPAVQAEVQGNWSATVGSNAQTVQWSLTTTGSMTGTSTTGCTYAGSVAALASTAAYGVSFNESCADGSKTTFNGVGTLNVAKNGLTVVVASADESRGLCSSWQSRA